MIRGKSLEELDETRFSVVPTKEPTMNFIRSILFAGFCLASGCYFSPLTLADSPSSAPTRLGSSQSDTGGVSSGGLATSRFAEIQLVAEIQFAADESASSDQAQSLESQQATEGGEYESANEASDTSSAGRESGEVDSSFVDSGEDETRDDEDLQRDQAVAARIAALKKPMWQITILATAEGSTPQNLARQFSQVEPVILISSLGIAPMGPNRYTTCLMHRPLYYEQPNLERCGRGCGFWQNGISAAQFLGRTVLLPYHLGQQPCDCLVPAGGDCLTCQSYESDCYLCPFDPCGLTTQAAAVAGFSLLFL